MTRSALYLALASALLASTAHASNGPVPKQLSGPPSEFAAMSEANPAASAITSKSALIPVQLSQNRQGLWQWRGQLPVENGDFRFVAFTGAGQDWQVNMQAPFGARSQSAESLAAETQETLYGMDNNEYPADYYGFDDLRTGNWTLEVNAASDAQTEGFVLINSESQHRLRAYQSNRDQFVGERISFVAYGFTNSLYAQKGGVPAANAELVNEAHLAITSPSGEHFTEAMYDDGLHGDGKAGDGIYGGDFLASELGNYNAQIVASGVTPEGTPFFRTTEHLVPVIDTPVTLASNFATSYVVDEQRMMVNLAVDGAKADSHYRVMAEVWGTSREGGKAVPVAWIGGMANTEDNNLSLGLDGRWIALAKAQAPFELRNVRVEDPNYFIPVLRQERLSMDMNAMPEAAFQRAPAAIDEAMIMGPRPAELNSDTRAGSRLLLVHGYCSGNAWGPVAGQFGSSSVFADFDQNRSHDQFARLIGNFGANLDSFGVVAHSQGGAASVHLYSFYWSGLDNAGPGRLIQSVGTPYQGTALAGNLAALGAVFGAGCGTNFDLTYDGAAQWLSGVPSFARSATNYYTTSFTDRRFRYDYCHIATDLFLSDPDDGTTERSRGQLSGAINRGHREGQCHTTGMRDPAQYLDSSRNSTMNANAAR